MSGERTVLELTSDSRGPHRACPEPTSPLPCPPTVLLPAGRRCRVDQLAARSRRLRRQLGRAPGVGGLLWRGGGGLASHSPAGAAALSGLGSAFENPNAPHNKTKLRLKGFSSFSLLHPATALPPCPPAPLPPCPPAPCTCTAPLPLPPAQQDSLKERYEATKGATKQSYDDWAKQVGGWLLVGLPCPPPPRGDLLTRIVAHLPAPDCHPFSCPLAPTPACRPAPPMRRPPAPAAGGTPSPTTSPAPGTLPSAA